MMTTSYLVLARKYRPQRFSDLTGQEHVVRTLVNALKSGRVAHAFLFTGPRGCGKTTSARILARALNCEKGPTPEPCGVCGPCVEIAQGNDVDVQEIDAASNNGVDDVRALREAARYLPARDRYKIYIVDEVHMLSGPAFNALLKTLEEPPGHIKFLLATTDPQKLPATILSRVQRHNIQLVPLSKIVARLREISQAENVAISDGALSLVARQAQGSMRDALSLLDQLFSAHDPAAGEISDKEAAETLGALDNSVVREIVSAILSRDAGAAMSGMMRAYDSGADFKRLSEELAAHARNLVLASLPGVKQDLPDHEIRELAQQAADHDPAQLSRVFELLQLAQDEVSKAQTPRHALEVAILRAVHLSPSSSHPDLVARIEALSKNGTPPAAKPERVIERESEPEERAPESMQSRWRRLIESVRAAGKAGAASALEFGAIQKIDRAGVTLVFRKGDLNAMRLSDKDTRAAVESAFEKALGFRASLQILEQDAPREETVADQRQKQRAAASSSRIAIAREHPAVRAAVDVLGGEIEDVRDLGEE